MTTCHITFEVLVDFVEGQLDRTTSERVSAHLNQGCSSCDERVQWIREIGPSIMRVSGLNLVRPPAYVLARAKAIARDFAENDLVRSLPMRIAELLFDNARPMALAGARGFSMHENQRVYATPEHYVDIWEEKQKDGRWFQIGQVISRAGEGVIIPAAVRLVDENDVTRMANIEGSEFYLPDIDPGTYSLSVQIPDAVIHVPEARVGE